MLCKSAGLYENRRGNGIWGVWKKKGIKITDKNRKMRRYEKRKVCIKNYGKKRTVRLFGAVLTFLFQVCLLPEFSVLAKEHGQYTSVTVEFRDVDTGKIFQIDTHP